jgi:hypothetical protein
LTPRSDANSPSDGHRLMMSECVMAEWVYYAPTLCQAHGYDLHPSKWVLIAP